MWEKLKELATKTSPLLKTTFVKQYSVCYVGERGPQSAPIFWKDHFCETVFPFPCWEIELTEVVKTTPLLKTKDHPSLEDNFCVWNTIHKSHVFHVVEKDLTWGYPFLSSLFVDFYDGAFIMDSTVQIMKWVALMCHTHTHTHTHTLTHYYFIWWSFFVAPQPFW